MLTWSTSTLAQFRIPQDQNVLGVLNLKSNPTIIDPLSFKVFVWNISKGRESIWKNDFLKYSAHSDILILQETYLSKSVKQVFNKLDNLQFSTAVSWIDNKNIKTGISIASKGDFEISHWQRSQFREVLFFTPKMTLFQKYRIKGRDDYLLVGNIHALNFVSLSSYKNMLLSATSYLSTHSGPAIFAGDFNTWSRKRLFFMNQVFKNLGYTQVHFKSDYRSRFFGNTVDHIWVKGLHIIKSEVIKLQSSDHNPLLIEAQMY